jgi:hypothetical protein
MKSILLATVLALSLGATAHAKGFPNPLTPFTPPTAAAPNIVTQVQQFTVTDLQTAIADATTRNDTRHLPCWQALLPISQSLGTTTGLHLPQAPGLATLAQTFFDDKGQINNAAWLDPIATACALTGLDLRMSLAQLMALVGVKALPAVIGLPPGL